MASLEAFVNVTINRDDAVQALMGIVELSDPALRRQAESMVKIRAIAMEALEKVQAARPPQDYEHLQAAPPAKATTSAAWQHAKPEVLASQVRWLLATRVSLLRTCKGILQFVDSDHPCVGEARHAIAEAEGDEVH